MLEAYLAVLPQSCYMLGAHLADSPHNVLCLKHIWLFYLYYCCSCRNPCSIVGLTVPQINSQLQHARSAEHPWLSLAETHSYCSAPNSYCSEPSTDQMFGPTWKSLCPGKKPGAVKHFGCMRKPYETQVTTTSCNSKTQCNAAAGSSLLQLPAMRIAEIATADTAITAGGQPLPNFQSSSPVPVNS
jgi:hypothetical protein